MDSKKLNSIIAGICPIQLGGGSFYVKRPSVEWRLSADALEDNFLAQFLDGGLLCDQDYEYFLKTNQIWSDADEDKTTSLSMGIEDLKVKLFSLNFNEREMFKAREVLRLATADLNKLFAKKHSYSFLSAKANAALEKMKFLFAGSVFSKSGKPLLTGMKAYSNFPCSLLDAAIHQYRESQADETEIRTFARTEPWRGMWTSRKATNCVFAGPSADLSEQQRALIAWSITYDAIGEHPNAPSENIVTDDSRLDGWLILQKREREKALGHNDLENIVKNDKIRNSSEVFIPVGSQKDLEKVESLNTDDASRVKRQRMTFLKSKGKVLEAEMPDSKIEINRLAHEKLKGKFNG